MENEVQALQECERIRGRTFSFIIDHFCQETLGVVSDLKFKASNKQKLVQIKHFQKYGNLSIRKRISFTCMSSIILN